MKLGAPFCCYERMAETAAESQATTTARNHGWHLVAGSVTGVRHADHNEPNQDRVATSSMKRAAKRIAMAVSDGHGNRGRHFRSEFGAHIACQAAMEVWNSMLEDLSESTPVGPICRRIYSRWYESVQAALRSSPFMAEELDRVPPAYASDLLDNPLLAYGATLVTAAITNETLIVIQIGDGDAVAVSNDDVRRLIASVPLIGSLTDSLCDLNALDKFRYSQVSFAEVERPQAILLATDGLANSFRRSDEETDFFKVSTDLLELVREIGPDQLERELPEMLASVSANGSQDDISIVFAS